MKSIKNQMWIIFSFEISMRHDLKVSHIFGDDGSVVLLIS